MLADRVGGLLMVGFDGTSATDAPADLIAVCAGVILFRRNLVDAAQIARLTAQLQGLAGGAGAHNLLMCIDQEGGTVSRLSGFGTTTPSAMALGAADDERLTERMYRIIGDELAALGLNLDFAPVADVNNNPLNPVIGIRSFGEDPAFVGRHVKAAIRGLHGAGVGATAKHFPGHGDTQTDSHHDLPVIGHAMERLRAVELPPFRAAAEGGVEAIMTAHVAFPALEPDLPATLSRSVLTRLLREELRFEGVICTDCMEMDAIAKRFLPDVAVVMAVEAGADLVLFSHDREKAAQALAGLRAAVLAGRLKIEQVERSLGRVDALRERLASRSGSPRPPLDVVGSAQHRRAAREASARAVTLVRDPRGVLPLDLQAGGRILVVNFAGDAATPVEDSGRKQTAFGKALARGAARVQEQLRSLDPAGHEFKQLLMAAGSASAIVAVTRRATQHPLQARAAADLASFGKPYVAVAAREPYDADVLPAEAAVLCTYGDDEAAQEAAAAVILGEAKPMGRLPVRLEATASSPL